MMMMMQQQQQQQQKQLVKICRVCGDKAHAFNFSGLPSCHSCRVFFYRNAPKREKLKCLKEGACLLDFVTRKCCSFCRLSRCFEIGMKVKEEKDAKNGGRGRGRAGGGGGKRRSGGKSTEIEREVEKETAFLETSSSSFSSPLSSSEGSSSHDISPVSSSPQEGVSSSPASSDKTSSSSSTSTSLDSTLREILINLNKMPLISVDVNPKMSTLTRAPSLMPPPPPSPPPPPLPQTLALNPFERAQLAELRSYSSHFPEETDLEIVPMTMTCAEGFNLSSNYARRGVKYCKQIPFFRTLSREDQLRLLKPTMFESMTIRAAFFYNKDRDTYMMLENEEGTRVVEVKCWCTELAENFQLAEENKRLTALLSEQMEKDTTIRCLLTMISLVKPAACLKNGKASDKSSNNGSDDIECKSSVSSLETIRYHYHFYCHLFRRYLQSKYGCRLQAEQKYAQLMSILLTDLVVMRENLKRILLEIGVDNLAEIIVETMNLKDLLSES